MVTSRYRLSTLCLLVAIVAVPLAGISGVYRMKAAAVRAQLLAARPLQRAAERELVLPSKAGAESQAQPPPSGWQTIVAADAFVPGCAFTFRAPPDLEPVPVRGIDSFVGRYTSPSLEVDFNYGWYPTELTPEDGFVTGRWITVDGKRARLARKPDVVAIQFPQVKVIQTMTMTMTMIVRLKDSDPEAAETILRSIEFP